MEELKEYYIDFNGYCTIKAKSREEAEKIFWDTLQKPCEKCYDDVYDIDNVEEKEIRK